MHHCFLKPIAATVWLMVLCSSIAQGEIAGVIVNDSGQGIAEARVFAEPGVQGALVEGKTEPNGTFTIPGEFFGNVGVFALAPAYGYGGKHLHIAAGDEPTQLRITLFQATIIAGQVTDAHGVPLSGARVSSVALTAPVKVGIPLAKLGEAMAPIPISDAEGRFRVDALPNNARVALKFEHSRYAQEAIMDLAAGETDVRVTMHRGVSVRGTVVIRGTDAPVSGAVVTARNAQPPHDTAFTSTDGAGVFTTRLKPGVYLFQAYGTGRISPGLQQVVVTGERPEQTVRLSLSETGVIAGAMRDAKTGNPIPGARVLLETMGHAADAARTGPDGQFRFIAAEGANTLHFESIEGYQAPDTRALRVSVPAGETLELPGLWLAPIPAYTLRVVEDDGETPVSGAFIALLWPRQFGWQQADAQGKLTLRFASLPEDNRVIGFVEHPSEDKGGLFSVDPGSASNAMVVLLPLARVHGRIVNVRGAPVAGAVVGGLFADDTLPDALPVWRCITDKEGRFSWPATPAGVPQRCIVTRGETSELVLRDINPAPSETIDLGDVTLAADDSAGAVSLTTWQEQSYLEGPELRAENTAGLVVFHCPAADAAVYIEAAALVREQLQYLNLETVVAVIDEYKGAAYPAAVPVYRSSAGRPGTTLYDAQGAPRLSLIGLPPLAALRQLHQE